MAFVTPVMEHWLEWEIAQWVHPMKDRSDDLSHYEQTLLPWRFSAECTTQQFVPCHMHIETPAESNDLECHVMPWCYWSVFHYITHHYEFLKVKLKLLVHIHGCTIFIQDGTPCHWSKVATEFLRKNKISLLECPDRNPIENLWTVIKDKVAYKHWEPEASNQGSLHHWNHPAVLLISCIQHAISHPISHWQQRRTY